MTIRSYKIGVTTSGAAGSATGEADSQPFAGRVLAVVLNPHASLPSTADTTVYITKDGDKNTNVDTVATFTNSGNTEGVIKRNPRTEVDDGAGVSLAAANKTNVFAPFVTSHGVHVEVVQADALTDAVVVEVIVEE